MYELFVAFLLFVVVFSPILDFILEPENFFFWMVFFFSGGFDWMNDANKCLDQEFFNHVEDVVDFTTYQTFVESCQNDVILKHYTFPDPECGLRKSSWVEVHNKDAFNRWQQIIHNHYLATGRPEKAALFTKRVYGGEW